jgi:hypothetical protein
VKAVIVDQLNVEEADVTAFTFSKISSFSMCFETPPSARIRGHAC